MAITLGAHASVAGASGGTTGNINTTGATLLIAALVFAPPGTGGVSDSQSNTWTPLTLYNTSFGDRGVRFFYCENPTTSASHNFSTTNFFAALGVAAFTGTLTASTFDNENGGTADAVTSVATGSITPNGNNELVVSALESGSASATDNASLTTIETVAFSGGNNYGLVFSYLVQGSAAAINVTWSVADVGNLAANIASFKPATTTARTSTLPRLGVG